MLMGINRKQEWELCRKDYQQSAGNYKQGNRNDFNQETSIYTSHFYGQFCKYGQIKKKFIRNLILPVNMGILDPFMERAC